MKSSVENHNQDQSVCNEKDDKLIKDEEVTNSGKSNSELMAEFFAISCDEDKK